MHALVGEQLLTAWDRGIHENDLLRPLTLLTTSSPELSRDSVATMSLAERDFELWRLRQMSFGEWLRATLPCAGCSAQIEFTLGVSAVIEALRPLQLTVPAQREVQGWSILMRPATTRDLEAVLHTSTPQLARQTLLDRCISLTDPLGNAAILEQTPEVIRILALEAFEEIHEGAEFTCEAICPQCGAVEMADLDIGRFLWFEVRNAARRLLREIHELASAYGWSESAILAMSSERRQSYLELVRA
jgi:hypothetical protein